MFSCGFNSGVGRQRQKADVLGHLQFVALLVPAGAVERDHDVGAGRDLRADLLEMRVHRMDVDMRQDQRRTDAASGTAGAEDVGPLVALIPRLARPAALLRPDIGQAALLADPGFILT